MDNVTLEAIAAVNIPLDFVCGVTRFRIIPNSIRDGSGRYDGVAFVAHSAYHDEHARTLFYTRSIADVVVFYDLIQRNTKPPGKVLAVCAGGSGYVDA